MNVWSAERFRDHYFVSGMIESAGLTAALIVCAGFTSFITTSFGVGGGVLLLAIVAQVLPPEVVIPLHGIVQLGSNASRSMMSWRKIDWSVIGSFVPGVVVGALLGSLVLVTLPPRYLFLSIASFTLLLCWGPQLPAVALGRVATAILGAVTTFATLFVGATGPLVGAFVRQMHADRFTTVATFATAMVLQHTAKIAVFQTAGVDLRSWLWLALSMVAAGAVGTWIGLRFLRKLSDRHFGLTFKVLLTLLSLRLIWTAFAG
mgnify:CR=1 FL=1